MFIDDSNQTDPPRAGLGRLLAIGGVMVPEQELAGFAADLAEIKRDLQIPGEEEIKWKPPKGSCLAAAGGERVGTLRRRMLESAISHSIRSTLVIVDHAAVYRSRTEAEVGREMLKWLYKRISMALSREGEAGVVIADKPGGGSAVERR